MCVCGGGGAGGVVHGGRRGARAGAGEGHAARKISEILELSTHLRTYSRAQHRVRLVERQMVGF